MEALPTSRPVTCLSFCFFIYLFIFLLPPNLSILRLTWSPFSLFFPYNHIAPPHLPRHPYLCLGRRLLALSTVKLRGSAISRSVSFDGAVPTSIDPPGKALPRRLWRPDDMATEQAANELRQQGAIEAARDPESSVDADDAQKKMLEESKAAGVTAFTFDPDASPEEKKAQAKAVSTMRSPARHLDH